MQTEQTALPLRSYVGQDIRISFNDGERWGFWRVLGLDNDLPATCLRVRAFGFLGQAEDKIPRISLRFREPNGQVVRGLLVEILKPPATN